MVKLIFFVILSLHANELPIQSLENASMASVSSIYKGQEKIAIIFQPDCHSCKEQISDLKCLKKPAFLVGAFHHRKSLQNEYLKLKTNLPGYQSSKELLKSWGVSEEITPQIVFLDKHGSVQKKIIGAVPCEELAAY